MGFLPMLSLNTKFFNPTHTIHSYPSTQISITVGQLNSCLPPQHQQNQLPNTINISNHGKLKTRIIAASAAAAASSPSKATALETLIFDCDGVILESEHLHRNAYNATFTHFNVCCPSSSKLVDWDAELYDQLQNQIGGGKPKMRWYFNENGWPSSTIFQTPPANETDKIKLIDSLQEWKTEKYKDIIRSGAVKPRPGVLQLMDEARAAGIKLAVCSAATKSSVILCLENLLGLPAFFSVIDFPLLQERFQQLDCFLAGDDVKNKKPDPSIYLEAAKRLGKSAKNCLVVEDSVIGLQAAIGAGMACVISYTLSTKDQDFKGAKAIYPDLSSVHLKDLDALLEDNLVVS